VVTYCEIFLDITILGSYSGVVSSEEAPCSSARKPQKAIPISKSSKAFATKAAPSSASSLLLAGLTSSKNQVSSPPSSLPAPSAPSTILSSKKYKVGPPLIFARLWKETGIGQAIQKALVGRKFSFDVEGAIFLTVLHRLMDPGSDRAAEKWKEDYGFSRAIADLDLQHLYRAMAWLGEELPADEQAGQSPFAPRCVKDKIEEDLFARRRDLFTEVAVVLFDTTSLYFEGEGGQTIGARGHNKDHRPDLKQMVLGLVIDGEGRPLCCELWPGNTTDVKTLLPIMERLKRHFRVGQVCIVADRGMISQEVTQAIESNEEIEYILGARMRSGNEVKDEVLGRAGRYREVEYHRLNGKKQLILKIKEVVTEGGRYVVCLSDEQAAKDAADREAIIASLEEQIKRGEKSLVGNKGYRKYLKAGGEVFDIDYTKAKEEARYDGKWVLKTNTTWSADEVAVTYKELWMVEALFRSIKSLLRTRPIYHKNDDTIRGHVFCSFLALVLMRELQERMWGAGHIDAEWAEVMHDLEYLDETEVETAQGKRFVIRGEVKGWCGIVFQAVGLALPRTLRRIEEKVTEKVSD
jgi:transposase